MHPAPYWYRARLTPKARQWDGDTIRVDIDAGFDMWLLNQSVRLARINAPERKGTTKERALVARDYLLSIIGDRDFFINTIQLRGRLRGKYGRWLVEIWVDNGGWRCANDLMVEAGHAEYHDYR